VPHPQHHNLLAERSNPMSDTTSQPNFAARRIVRLAELYSAANSILTLGTISVQREIHNIHAECKISANTLHVLQSEWNGVQDHLESFLETLSSIRSAIELQYRKDSLAFAHDGVRRDNHPDNNDRDAGRVCPTCDHDLELNADFQCVRCGSHA
jgi:hypothetical protein